MADFWKKYNIWISSTLFLVLAGGLVWFVILPLEKNIRASADNIQITAIDDSLNQARIAKIPEMEKAEAAFTENKNNLDIMLNSDNEVDFIKSLESLAQETNNKIDLKIEDNTPVSPATAPGKKDPDDIRANLPYDSYLSFQINLQGKYGDALNFIHKLENMNYYVNVISFSMAKGSVDLSSSDTAVSPFGSGSAAQGTDMQPQSIPVLKSSLEAVVYLHK